MKLFFISWCGQYFKVDLNVFYLEILVRMDLCLPAAQSALSGKEKFQNLTLHLLAMEINGTETK
jgi:hypothetical protein